MTRRSHLNAQKEIEWKHLRRFLNTCNDSPAGRIEPGETPDFILYTDCARIGIEHTQIYVDNGSKRGSLQSLETIKDRIVEEAEILLQEYDLPELYVDLFFNPASSLKKLDEDRIARAVVETVARNCPQTGDHVWVKYKLKSTQPIEVDLILIYQTTNFGTNHWRWREAGEVLGKAISKIQCAIDRKVKKLNECLVKCDECWLLVVAPSWTPAGMVHPNTSSLQHTYMSEFDRTYFLNDSLVESVVRLNTSALLTQE